MVWSRSVCWPTKAEACAFRSSAVSPKYSASIRVEGSDAAMPAPIANPTAPSSKGCSSSIWLSRPRALSNRSALRDGRPRAKSDAAWVASEVSCEARCIAAAPVSRAFAVAVSSMPPALSPASDNCSPSAPTRRLTVVALSSIQSLAPSGNRS